MAKILIDNLPVGVIIAIIMSMEEEQKLQSVVVTGVLIRQGKVLLVKRAANDRMFPGFWELPGGKVEFNEDAIDALKREFLEETGLNVTAGAPIRNFHYLSDDGMRHYLEFVFYVQSNDYAVRLSEEHEEYAWVSGKDLADYQITDDELKTLEKAMHLEQPLGDKTQIAPHQHVEIIKLFTDGGSRGNPGPSASGFVLYDSQDAVLEEGGEYLGITTNNQAEYQAVRLGLKAARRYGPKEVHIYMDSLLVVNQMNGSFKIRNRDLWPIHEDIKNIATEFGRVTFTHVPRAYNKAADAMVNRILDDDNHSG